ncbi:MAG: hypothetical protein NUV50_08385 [Rhodospirillales bacterium]|nr:hypothetical protein [Rhodospirillales bacterium]
MSAKDEDLLFWSFRKVICDLYFAGWNEGRDCANCRDTKKCYGMIQDAMQYAKTHELRITEVIVG